MNGSVALLLPPPDATLAFYLEFGVVSLYHGAHHQDHVVGHPVLADKIVVQDAFLFETLGPERP